MLVIKTEFSDYSPWSGAKDTYNRIEEENKLDMLESILEDLYPDGMTDTELNDLLWFESEQVFEWLGISEDDDSEEEE